MSKIFISSGAGLAALYVGLGAYASHGLKPHLNADLYAVFQTGLHYHIIHSLALVLLGLFLRNSFSKLAVSAGVFLFAGIILFSFSLYLYAGFGLPVSSLTPIGGMSYIAGWILFMISALFYQDRS